VSDFGIKPFDHDRHAAFVFATFQKSVGSCWPWSLFPKRAITNELKRVMAGPESVSLVGISAEDPNHFLGWVVTVPSRNEIVFAYTDYECRRFGVGSTLAIEGGIDFERPVPVRFWTRASSRIQQRDAYRGLFFNQEGDAGLAASVGLRPRQVHG